MLNKDNIKFADRIAELRKVGQPSRKLQSDDYYTTILRRFTIYLTFLVLKLDISANAITVLSGVIGLAGSVAMILDSLWLTLLGAFFWQLFRVLDCVDGEVARIKHEVSKIGFYLDQLTHIFVNPTFVLALGVHVCLKSTSITNIVSTFMIFGCFIWSKNIRRISKQMGYSTRKYWKNPLLYWLRVVAGYIFSEDWQMFFVPAAIVLGYLSIYEVTCICLYAYALFYLAFIAFLAFEGGCAIMAQRGGHC